MRRCLTLCALLAACGGTASTPAPTPVEPAAEAPALRHPDEIHLTNVRQLTRGAGENAEAYWSFDGTELIFQSNRPPHQCDQIFRIPADGSAEPTLVSTGQGRTTCSYFFPDRQRIVYSSTHLTDPTCPPTPDHSQGYVWPIYASYEIVTADPAGSDLRALTDNDVYDAEATVCPVDGRIIFTSTRDGDLDLYVMNPDGSEVTRITERPGYDGGAFFNADCSKIVWRASRPEGQALADYQRLLAQNLVRPGKLEIYVADADGSSPRQVTYLDAASFAPYFHPSGTRILFSSNYGDPQGREFDIWAIDADGTDLERITHTPGFDGFPMFSPDGSRLAFASNRNQAAEGQTDVYVASWVDQPVQPVAGRAADRIAADVAWLADPAREGRGVGTAGLEAAAGWLEQELAAAGARPGYGGQWRQSFEVPVSVARGPKTQLVIDRKPIAADAFVPSGYSTSGRVEGRTAFAGYGISAPELDRDDYEKVDVKGKIAVVRRFVPDGEAFADDERQRRFGDLHYKAWNARRNGAIGLIVVDTAAEEAPLPPLRIERLGDAGIPVVVATAAAAGKLTKGRHRVALEVELETTRKPAHNIVGLIPAGAADKLPGAVVIGAHYDHLGFGGEGSLDPDSSDPHLGADDNASGTAALIEIARLLAAGSDRLRRDVYLVAFSGEESGLVGSSAFVEQPPAGLELADVVAMLNMDMVGRLRGNQLAVLGTASAVEWTELVTAACERARLGCTTGGDGYGPSDQTPFYAAGAPVLHFFTGAHEQYHKPSDTSDRINAAGLARIAGLVADVAAVVGARADRLTYQQVAAPAPMGADRRSYGASLGTIPDYSGAGDEPGVLLTGVRTGGPAEQAGLRRGDRIVKIGTDDIASVRDLMHVLQAARPHQTVTITVIRDGKPVELEATYGESRRR